MSGLQSDPIRLNVARTLFCMSMLAQVGTPANAEVATQVAKAGASAPDNSLLPRPFMGDNPVAVRDTLAKQNIGVNSPSLSERIRYLIHNPFHELPSKPDLASRELTFVVPAQYGIRYRTEKHLLTVDADLSGDDARDGILLQKTINGPSGRGLVVAPEARSKGYIQHIDLIKLETGEAKKTTVQGRVALSRTAFNQVNGDFAIVLMCRLAPPYLTDRTDHTDPNNDEPTDITTRTSRLYVNIDAIWLVSPQRRIVLSKKLQLSK